MNTLIVPIFLISLGIIGYKVAFPEPLDKNLSYRIFDSIYWLAVSYIPGFIMYWFVVEIPKRTYKRKLGPHIASITSMLVGDGRSILTEFIKASKYQVKFLITKEDVNEITCRIEPYGNAPLLKNVRPIEYENWIGYLVFYRNRSKKTLDELFKYKDYLDIEHVRLITRLNDSTFFAMIEMVANNTPMNNRDLSFISDSLYRYYDTTRQLEEYINKHLRGLAWSEGRG